MTLLWFGILFVGGSIYVVTWTYLKLRRKNAQGIKK